MTVDDWLALDRRGLAAALSAGHPIAPEALDDSRYVGLSLGMPGWVDRLAWKIFEKDFHRDPVTGLLRGWNVRLAQRDWRDDPEPLLKHGEPITFGHYGVRVDPGTRRPAAVPGGLLLDYGAGDNPWWDPVRRVRDPLVAVHTGLIDLLLGWTWVDLGLGTLGTPSYFLLRRHGALVHECPASGCRPMIPRMEQDHGLDQVQQGESQVQDEVPGPELARVRARPVSSR